MFRSPFFITLAVLLAHSGVSLLAEAQSQADSLQRKGPPRKQDDVYRISTRKLADPESDKPIQLDLQRWNESDNWEPVALDTFCRDSDSKRMTLIYVHGYNFDAERADQIGWAFYHAICKSEKPRRPLRFVFWSWPTTRKAFRPTRDLADKALRADADAYYLAKVITELKADEPVCVIGSSLGCRVVEGALHFVGGGTIEPWKLEGQPDKKAMHLRAAFITPCVHDDWLYEGGYHDRAVAGASHLLLINNSVDSMLLRYSKVWRSHPIALGLDGIQKAAQLGDLAKRIEQLDAHEEIGDNHGVEFYLRSPMVMERLRTFTGMDRFTE